MKLVALSLMLTVFCSSAIAAEEAEHGGEHEAHKPPPVPSKGSPVGDVYHLPVVLKWGEWMASRDSRIAIWGEYIDTVDGQKCSRVAVGQSKSGMSFPWKHFCVPQMGGDILVDVRATPKSEAAYMPYDDWVTKCKPTGTSGGDC
jgi:hypothetical protein